MVNIKVTLRWFTGGKENYGRSNRHYSVNLIICFIIYITIYWPTANLRLLVIIVFQDARCYER